MLHRSLLPGALALGTFWLAGCGDTATEPPASAEPTTGAPVLAVTSNSWITRPALPMTRSGHAVAELPHVLQAQRLFGDPDYLLHVIARDLPTECKDMRLLSKARAFDRP